MWTEQHSSELGSWRTLRRDAAPPLRPHLQDLLAAESNLPTALQERRLPGLSVSLVLNFGDPHRLSDGQGERTGVNAWLVGLQSSFRLAQAVGARKFMVVQLSPIGAHLIVRQSMDKIADRIVELSDLDPRLARELISCASRARDWPQRFEAVETVLADRLADKPAHLPAQALARVSGEPGRLEAVAAELGCSHRHLIAQFRERIGLTPKTVARISRFNRALAAIHREMGMGVQLGRPHLDLEPGSAGASRALSWADLAAAHGYFDQSHFIKDFRTFSGTSPSEFVSALRPDTVN